MEEYKKTVQVDPDFLLDLQEKARKLDMIQNAWANLRDEHADPVPTLQDLFCHMQKLQHLFNILEKRNGGNDG